MHKPSSDLERVYRALAEQWEVRDLTCNLAIIAKLQGALKKGEWKITCAVNSRVAGGGSELVAIWPGFHDRIFGLAVDVAPPRLRPSLQSTSGDVVAPPA
jgi:uncharacterized 2Fe-2S/4Fe-4S cluster protein (DUF4445 family)